MASLLDRLPTRRRGPVDPRTLALARELDERRAAVRQAEEDLRAAVEQGATVDEVARRRRQLDDRFGAALESAEAAYRAALGPVEGLSRVAYLARLTGPEVRQADAVRQQLRLATAHYRAAARDDLGTYRIAGVPPTVGTRAEVLATRADPHGGH